MKSQGTIQMEEAILKFTEKVQKDAPNSINKMMNYELTDCNFEEKTLTHKVEVAEWMLNPSKVMHGGLVATSLDIAFGTLAIFLAQGNAPTIELNINYIRPVTSDDTILIKAHCVSNGRTLSHLRGEVISTKTEKVCATATGVFFSGATHKS